MKLKKLITVLLAISICMLFCGCDLFDNTDDLVSPPELTGDMAPIAEALYAATGSGLNLEYPAAGNHRSAIVLEDINADGSFEAFAFYSTSDDELSTMHINVICQKGDEWESVSDQTIVATGVEMIDFCDLNDDGVKEILVGWDVNGASEKQLSVFAFDQKHLSQQLLQAYTGFLCCDLDQNGTNELFVHLLNTTEKTNKAIVYNLGPEGMAQTAGCLMDGSVKSAAEPVLSTLSNGQNAIYIDEIKGVGAITEVLYISKGEMKNPLLDTVNSLENIVTLRGASLSTQDINGDGILEIPIASDLPNAVTDGEKLYYTNWCSFNGEVLAAKLITVVNTVDGYYLSVPNSMIGNISVLKDIENHERRFYHYDNATQTTGELLFEVTVIPTSEWDNRDFNRGSLVELSRRENTVFVVGVTEAAQRLGVNAEIIKSTFNLIN